MRTDPEAQARYVPALRFSWLTGAFDPVVALTTRERAFKERLLEQADPRPEQRILDVGCGTGTLSIQVKKAEPRCDVVGLDGDPEILRRAEAKARREGVEVRFEQGFSTSLPFPDASFDTVLSTLFFHHIDSQSKATTALEIARVLRPGGQIHVADWTRPRHLLTRSGFALVRLLDGFENTRDNATGSLPAILEGGGLGQISETARFRTAFGELGLLSGRRPSRHEASASGASVPVQT